MQVPGATAVLYSRAFAEQVVDVDLVGTIVGRHPLGVGAFHVGDRFSAHLRKIHRSEQANLF